MEPPSQGPSNGIDNYLILVNNKAGTVAIGGPEANENDDEDDEDDMWGGAPNITALAIDSPAETSGVANLWEDDKPKKKDMDQIVCPTHGLMCKRGICSDYSRLKRQQDKENQVKEREKERRDWREKAKKKAEAKDQSESRTCSRS